MIQNENSQCDNVDNNSNIVDFYNVLDVSKNATLKEIREAYFRLKNTYNVHNQALYSLIDEDERNENFAHVIEAYRVLSNVDSRLKYDLRLIKEKGLQREDFNLELQTFNRKYYQNHSNRSAGGTYLDHDNLNLKFDMEDENHEYSSYLSQNELSMNSENNLHYKIAPKIVVSKTFKSDKQLSVSKMIEDAKVVDGSLLMRIREKLGVSREEIQDHTKISFGYICYLEEERFDLLPQKIYVKGFLNSYLKFLSVKNYENIVKLYVERFEDWLENKS